MYVTVMEWYINMPLMRNKLHPFISYIAATVCSRKEFSPSFFIAQNKYKIYIPHPIINVMD